MKNRIHILTGLALALTLASCGKKEESKAEGAATAAAVPAGDLEEIKLDFPKPMFIGTPVPAELPNLEKADPSKVVKSFQAPKGTVNLAKGKKVTSSDSAPIIGDLNLVTDGDADGADGSFVELMPGKQWVQIDLEAPANIYKIAMWHYHKQAQAYIDVLVQVSDDPEFKTGVTTVFNSDHDDTSGCCLSKARRCRSVIPPQTPNSTRLSSASAPHSVITGQCRQMTAALRWAAPRTRLAWRSW